MWLISSLITIIVTLPEVEVDIYFRSLLLGQVVPAVSLLLLPSMSPLKANSGMDLVPGLPRVPSLGTLRSEETQVWLF